MGYNIIGDIAGNYLTLRALLDKMPKDAVPTSLGDMVDRGPRSKEVLDFFMNNGKALFGNHEHMMLDHFTNGLYYEPGLWINVNGGAKTMESFGLHHYDDKIDEKYLNYIKSLPLYIELEGNDDYTNGVFLSHAPRRPDVALSLLCELGDGFYRPSYKFRNMDSTLLWNRGAIKEIKDTFQIHGHNANKEIEWHKNQFRTFGVNLDTSRGKILTGMHWPSMEIFQQEYID